MADSKSSMALFRCHHTNMKSLIQIALTATAVLMVVTHSSAEKIPAGAVEKVAAATPDKAFVKPLKARKMLVFSKTNGFRHDSIVTGKLALTELGRKTGAFEVVISDDLANFEADKIKQFDAVCFLSTTQNVFAPHPKDFKVMSEEAKAAALKREGELKDSLMNFLKSGGGFVGIHAATDTCYEWPDYGKMLGGYFNGHPWGANKMVSIKVEPGQEKHPLVAMFEGKNVDFPEEIYQFKEPYDSKAVHMLLRLDTEKTDMTVNGIKRKDNDFGVSWARHWDKGRIFYSSLGHNHEIYWHAKVVRHYLAGIQWALGDYQVEVK